LPAPNRPASVASGSGVSQGARGYSAYRPGARHDDVTGSVPPRPSGHWTWDGGQPVTVGHNETIDTIARKHGVPAQALMQTNGINDPGAIRPGQRLVIPRYVYDAPQPARAAAAAPVPRSTAGSVHVVGPGETLFGIARRTGVSVSEIARTNSIDPHTHLKIGDRLTIPGGGRVAARQAPVPRIAQPATVATGKVASAPVHNARVAKAEVDETESVPAKAEAAGTLPSFRWPVKGRIIAGFGPRPNGTQNDGINLAVPEGTPVKAAEDGVVAYAGNELKGYGNLVLVRHAGGYVSAYANASNLTVKRGDTVKRGQVIAHAGQTGNVTSPQLHFEIRKGSTPVDPTKYLSGV
jgi:murein DD-endopeptidase MepM/ murein hydrolase activator NlpD